MPPARPLKSLYRVTSLCAGAVFACAQAGPAFAQPLPMQRLDVPLAQPPKAKPEPAVAPQSVSAQPKTAAGRVKFATQLAAAFRAGGYSLEISSQETGADEPKRFPKLTIAGVFDEPFVFKMISAWKFREPALKSGFRSIDIVSRLGQRRYVYDMSTGTVPKCDTQERVCN